jgi:hypothetical protein
MADPDGRFRLNVTRVAVRAIRLFAHGFSLQCYADAGDRAALVKQDVSQQAHRHVNKA